MEDVKVNHLKSLLHDMKTETNELIAYHKNELRQVAAIVNGIADTGTSINHNHFSGLAEIILSRISFMKKTCIQRLGDTDDGGRSMSLAQYVDLYGQKANASLRESLDSNDFKIKNSSDNEKINGTLVHSTPVNLDSLSPTSNGSLSESNLSQKQIEKISDDEVSGIRNADYQSSLIINNSLNNNQEVVADEKAPSSSGTVCEVNESMQDNLNLNSGDEDSSYDARLLSGSDSFESVTVKPDLVEINSQKPKEIPIVQLKLGYKLDAQFLKIVTPSELYLFFSSSEDCDHFSSLMLQMQKVARIPGNSKQYLNQAEAKAGLGSDYCMAYDKFADFWYRAKVVNWPTRYDKLAEVYLSDTGTTTIVNVLDIQPIPRVYTEFPAIATKCHLHNLRSVDVKWPVDSIKFFDNFEECICEIVEEINGSYGVILSVEDVNINEELIKRGWAKNTFSVREPLTPQEIIALEKIRMEKEDLTSTSNASVAVVGYEPKDEQRICRFYNHSTGKCFKAHHCTKDHELKNPDGWTKDRKPSNHFTLPPLIAPKIGTIVKMKVTNVDSPVTFSGTYEPIAPSAHHFGSLSEFANYMNSEEVVSSLKKLKCEPEAGELVIAPYEMDNCYYRAEVIEYSEEDGVKVLFIDYGNVGFVELEDLRQISLEFTLLPAQAVPCVIVNAMELPPNEEVEPSVFEEEITDKMEAYLLHKVVHCKIIDIIGNELCVIARVEGKDVALYLEELEYAKRISVDISKRRNTKLFMPA